MNPLETVGRVSKSFGLCGELIINLYDCFPADFDMEEPLFAKVDSLTVPLFFDKFAPRGGGRSALVKFADFDTDARAAELIGKDLYIISGSLVDGEESDDDEVYFEDLVGFSVSFDDNTLKGTISAFIDSKHNPLFEIKAGEKEIYVPAQEEMIAALDVDKREIEFSLPEGLLDLYL